MATTLSALVDLGSVDHLVRLVGQPGPMAPVDETPVGADRTALEDLERQGVLSAGAVAAEFVPAVQNLCQPLSRVLLNVVGPAQVIAYDVFLGADGATSLSPSEDGLLLQHPAPNADVIAALASITGLCTGRTIALECTVSTLEGLVVAALVDLARRERLASMARDSSDPEVVFHSSSDVASFIAGASSVPMSLVQMMRALATSEVDFSATSVHHALTGLIEGDLVEHDGQGFRVGLDLLQAAMRLAAPDTLVRVDAARVDNASGMTSNRFILVQSGPQDVLYVEPFGDSFFMRGVSTEIALAMVGGHLTSPDYIPVDEAPAAHTGPSQPAATSAFCGKCGNAKSPGPKFCAKCGNAVG